MASKTDTRTLVRIENLTDAVIDLPPVPATREHPKGFPARPLIPGGNNVPVVYLAALTSYETTNQFGEKVRPHANLLTKLAEPQTKWHHMQFPHGKIRINEDPKATLRREGEEPPRDLRTVSIPAALDFVVLEQSVEQLRLWRETETRSDVIHGLEGRIAKLS
jgi:hypothetical protein